MHAFKVPKIYVENKRDTKDSSIAHDVQHESENMRNHHSMQELKVRLGRFLIILCWNR